MVCHHANKYVRDHYDVEEHNPKQEISINQDMFIKVYDIGSGIKRLRYEVNTSQ